MRYGIFILYILVFSFIAQPLQAKYEPNVTVPKNQVSGVKDGVAAMKKLPVSIRDAIIAEKLGLLFMPAGDVSAYHSKPMINKRENTMYYDVYDTAKYMGSDGKMYDFREVQRTKVHPSKQFTHNWIRAQRAIYVHGVDAVFTAFADEVTKVVLSTAKNRLDSMPKETREAFFAELAGWLFSSNEKSGYTGGKGSWRADGTSRIIEWDHVCTDAKFIDSDGKTLSHEACLLKRKLCTWSLSYVCARLIGIEDILSLYPTESEIMHNYYSEHMKKD